MSIVRSPKLHLFFVLVLSALILGWYYHIYQIYFESGISDLISLLTLQIFGLLIGFKIKPHISGSWSYLSILILATLLPCLQPLVFHLLGKIIYLWAIMHVAIAICGLSIGLIAKPSGLILPAFSVLSVWLIPYHIRASQNHYHDKVVNELNTRKGFVQWVEWKGDQWLYYNNQLLSSTIDQHMLSEALVHPAMHLTEGSSVLLIGGDNLQTARELKKHTASIDIMPIDAELYAYFQNVQHVSVNPIFTEDIPNHLRLNAIRYDVILIDLPFEASIEYQPFASSEFLKLCLKQLRGNGVLTTRSFNPYLNLNLFNKHQDAISELGLPSIPYHAQIPTIGESSWILTQKNTTKENLLQILKTTKPQITTEWWDAEAMQMMLSFGKQSYFEKHTYLVNELQSNQ